MVTRSADWVLAPDPNGGAPIWAAECTTCLEESPADTSRDVPDVWCVRHCGSTGHTGYRVTVMSFVRVGRPPAQRAL
ncbi:hypothetical protein [Streptomyces sp. RFCAC02]|uniref:DUF7848 domain-containing protein n=1 Tax=Streptomyces sp. RFCAC02 TaxID=2499143 RepID=UPI0010212A28|nr:hypothetical protein [Streptomyces sp. RFCAC02]